MYPGGQEVYPGGQEAVPGARRLSGPWYMARRLSGPWYMARRLYMAQEAVYRGREAIYRVLDGHIRVLGTSLVGDPPWYTPPPLTLPVTTCTAVYQPHCLNGTGYLNIGYLSYSK